MSKKNNYNMITKRRFIYGASTKIFINYFQFCLKICSLIKRETMTVGTNLRNSMFIPFFFFKKNIIITF